MIKLAVPLLHVSNAAAAQDFYCTRLGFHLEYAHGPNGADGDPCYLGLSRDGVWIALSSFSGDGVAGGVVNLLAGDVDALFAEFAAAGVPIDLPPPPIRRGAHARCMSRTRTATASASSSKPHGIGGS
jgi:catechol 2,3-dioxygenase-like lactoylglutathione lyase family enzyme